MNIKILAAVFVVVVLVLVWFWFREPEFIYYPYIDVAGYDIDQINISLEQAKEIVRNSPNIKSFTMLNNGTVILKSAGRSETSKLKLCFENTCSNDGAGWYLYTRR